MFKGIARAISEMRKKKEGYPKCETKDKALNLVCKLILHRATQEELNKWLEIMIRHNAYQPYPKSRYLNRVTKETFLARQEREREENT